MSMIYGLLHGTDAVDEVVQELIDAGFDGADISLVGMDSGDDPSAELARMGVPELPAAWYARAIRTGCVFVHLVVHGRAEHSRAEDLLEEMGIFDLGWSPGGGSRRRLPMEREPVGLLSLIVGSGLQAG